MWLSMWCMNETDMRLLTDGFEIQNFHVSFVKESANNISWTTGRFDGKCARFNSNSINISHAWAGATEVYLRFALRSYNTSTPGQYVRLMNGSTVYGALYFGGEGSPAKLYIGGSEVATTTWNLVFSQWFTVEIRYKVDDTSGVFTVKVDGDQVGTYSGDTKVDTGSVIDKISFITGAAGGTSGYDVDDVALNDTSGGVDDTWCGEGHVVSIRPNANGDSSMLVGSDGNSTDNYLLVDEETPDSDTTYVTSETPDDYDLYGMGDITLAVGDTVLRVFPVAIAKNLVGDGSQIKLGFKINGTEYWDTSSHTPGQSYAAIAGEVRTVNPDDSAAWEEADVDGLQAGVKIV